MTKKERILCAMNGKPVDRVPVSFYTHLQSHEDNLVPRNVNWVKDTGMDMICIEPDGYYSLLSEHPLRTIEDWKRFRPYSKDHPFIERQVDRASRVAEALQDDAAVYYMAFTPFAFFRNTVGGGQTLCMEYWNTARDEMQEILKVLEESNFNLLEELKKTGIDGLFVSMQHAETWRFTREDYLKYMAPYDHRLIDYVNANFKNNIGHLCSWETNTTNSRINFDLYQDYAFQTMNWGIYQRDSMTMAEGKQYFTRSKAVMGGFDRNPEGVLYSGNEEEIKAFTKNLIRETGSEGFILSADCSIVVYTPEEHIRWVVEAAEEFAQGK